MGRWLQFVLFALLFCVSTKAQELLPADDIQKVKQLLDRGSEGNTLQCHLRRWGPLLTFSLQYVASFQISATMRQLEFGETLNAYIRITPNGRPPVYLTESFEIPATPPQVSARLIPMKYEANMYGSFGLGEGRYAVELLLLDQHGRTFFKRWDLKTSKYEKRSAAPRLAPLTASSVQFDAWNRAVDPDGARLVVLLDATATSPWTASLPGWNGDFLLSALGTLLGHVPNRSAEVIAFNLDLQREIFRQKNFETADSKRLATALSNVQFATVPYQALERGSWLKFLAGLTRESMSASDPPDAIVFIGASTHFDQKVAQAIPGSLRRGSLHFFYLEYYGFRPPFPDAIDYLTREMHGQVFRINNPDQFGVAIQKMLVELKPENYEM